MFSKMWFSPSILPLLFFTLCFLMTFTEAEKILPVNNTSACGPKKPQIVTINFGFLTSPNYDNFHYYPAEQNCSWILQAPMNEIIVLKPMNFAMNLDCQTDYLEIIDGENHVGRHCGYFFPSRYRSKTNRLTLHFVTGKFPKNVGFHFFFEHGLPIVHCKKHQIQCRHQTKCVDKSKVCDGIDDCKDGTDEEKCDKILLPARCGIQEIPPVLGNDRIVGGRDAIPGSWPWQISLRRLDLIPYSHMCGAVLINTQWIVTAAHCFKKSLDVQLWNALMGKHLKLVPDETEEVRYLESIHVHPDYKGFEAKLSAPWLVRKQHDIALVKLNAPVSVNKYVIPICLPERSRVMSPGTMCYVTGWGDTYGSGFELVLKQAVVPVISRTECRRMHRFYPIAETMVCAGYPSGGHDSCQGDSGGPLVFYEDGKWKLAGIVSTGGSICAEKEEPGIYTSIPYYMDWINNVTTRHWNN